MTSCPVIVADDYADIELSTYIRTVGTYVVISCKGFGRQVREPTSVTCLSTGQWSTTPVLECYTALDEKESIIVGVSAACAALVILTLIGVCCYCCCYKDKFRRNRWWNRYDEDDYRINKGYDYSPRGSVRRNDYFYSRDRDDGSYYRGGDYDIRKTRRASLDYDYRKPRIRSFDRYDYRTRRSSFDEPLAYRRTRRYSDGDRFSMYGRNMRTTRRYSYDDAPVIDFPRRRRYSDPSVYTSFYRAPERVRYREALYATAPPVQRIIQEIEPQPVHHIVQEIEPPTVQRIVHEVEPPPVYTEQPIVVKYEEEPVVFNYEEPPIVQQVRARPRVVRRVTRRYVAPKNYDSPPVYSDGFYSDVGIQDKVRLQPYDGGSSYYGGNLRTTKIVPAANIVELDNEVVPRSTIKTGHYEISSMQNYDDPKSTTNYFFGRQDYPYEERKQGLSHVLYHGNGKTTKIFEDDDGTIY